MPRTAKVTEKNTKGEILDAYRELLHEASIGESTLSPEENAVVASASKETVEKITKDLTQLKLSLTQTISDLTDRLTQEAERFATIQKAIAVAQRELEETQAVKVRIGMLKRMIELEQQKEEAFEKEMAAKRRVWEAEQRDYEENRKRLRQRDEEEYQYQKEVTKSRDHEDREAMNRSFERDLAFRKDELAQTAIELEQLRKKIAAHPSEIDKAVKEAVAAAVAKEKESAGVSAKLAGQEAGSNLALAHAKIASLEELVKTQGAEITRLNRELAQATNQVKEIAIAVAEGQRKEPPLSLGKSSNVS